jgi:hypothetical protein
MNERFHDAIDSLRMQYTHGYGTRDYDWCWYTLNRATYQSDVKWLEDLRGRCGLMTEHAHATGANSYTPRYLEAVHQAYGPSKTTRPIINAIAHGRVGIVKFMLEHDYTCDRRVMLAARLYGETDILALLADSGKCM